MRKLGCFVAALLIAIDAAGQQERPLTVEGLNVGEGEMLPETFSEMGQDFMQGTDLEMDEEERRRLVGIVCCIRSNAYP
jgi:hypothetical protein